MGKRKKENILLFTWYMYMLNGTYLMGYSFIRIPCQFSALRMLIAITYVFGMFTLCCFRHLSPYWPILRSMFHGFTCTLSRKLSNYNRQILQIKLTEELLSHDETLDALNESSCLLPPCLNRIVFEYLYGALIRDLSSNHAMISFLNQEFETNQKSKHLKRVYDVDCVADKTG